MKEELNKSIEYWENLLNNSRDFDQDEYRNNIRKKIELLNDLRDALI